MSGPDSPGTRPPGTADPPPPFAGSAGAPAPDAAPRAPARPRLGFLGVGRIGLERMRAVADSGLAAVAAVADPSPESLERAGAAAPGAAREPDLEALLERDDLDGLVIATPGALHARQCVAALERGLAVFCQKPLGRTAAEAWSAVDAARHADRLLAVDLPYRHAGGVAAMRERVRRDELGTVFAAELLFHDAHGPDRPWSNDRARSGGGCVMDLGLHLVDLALWVLDFPRVTHVTSRLYAQGAPLGTGSSRVEDYATARLDLAGGATLALACSWHLHAGRDAVLSATFHGTRGGAALRNVDGSPHDLVTERLDGATRTTLTAPPDAWAGRAVVEWARRLGRGARYDDSAERLVDVASALDRIYRR